MCEAIVYVESGEGHEKFMEDVVEISEDGEKVLCVDIFGEQKIVGGFIQKADLIKHAVYIKRKT